MIAQDNLFDVDVFTGRNEGLVIAEFEGSAAAVAQMRKPWFASREVTRDQEYSNDALAKQPYATWSQS